MIRAATVDDLPRLVAMGQRFRQATAYAAYLEENPDQMRAIGQHLIEAADGLLLVAEQDGAPVGMIGLLIFVHYLSAERVAGEVFWWMEPEARGLGIRLLRQAEAWAAARGAQRIQVIAPTDQVGRIYARLGYTKIETAYQRTVSPC